MKISIKVSWPNKILWPNGPAGRVRANRTRIKNAAKQEAFWLAKAAIQRAGEKPTAESLGGDPIPVRLVIHAKPKGPLPDRDNCVAVCKAYLDGLAEAININDRLFNRPDVVFDAVRDGWIVIEVGS